MVTSRYHPLILRRFKFESIPSSPIKRFMVGSHCRSDQPDRPDRPNPPTKLDQLFYTTFFPTATRTYTTPTRPPMIHPRLQPDNHPNRYSIIPIPTRSLLDQLDLYSISTRKDRPINMWKTEYLTQPDIFYFSLEIWMECSPY